MTEPITVANIRSRLIAEWATSKTYKKDKRTDLRKAAFPLLKRDITLIDPTLQDWLDTQKLAAPSRLRDVFSIAELVFLVSGRVSLAEIVEFRRDKKTLSVANVVREVLVGEIYNLHPDHASEVPFHYTGPSMSPNAVAFASECINSVASIMPTEMRATLLEIIGDNPFVEISGGNCPDASDFDPLLYTERVKGLRFDKALLETLEKGAADNRALEIIAIFTNHLETASWWKDHEGGVQPQHDYEISAGIAPLTKTTPKGSSMTGTPTTTLLASIAPDRVRLIDVMLADSSLPSLEKLTKTVDDFAEAQQKLKDLEGGPRGSFKLTIGETKITSPKGGAFPNGKLVQRKAHEVFGVTKGEKAFDFDIPTYEWDAPHPLVPEIDTQYIFRPQSLMTALWSLLTNKKMWIYGHSGVGKSTLIEQIAARCHWPRMLMNLDSELTRLDVVGRDTLVASGGGTETKFVDGILPRAMAMPCILQLEEIDFIRPDVAYVLQRVLESGALTITEDGSRIVEPHPMFRIVATANTQGQGDDTGLYQGARIQSAAFLDRFTAWVDVPRLSKEEMTRLLSYRCPSLDKELVEKMVEYSHEHVVAFEGGTVALSMSPRALTAMGEAYSMFSTTLSHKKAVEQAMNATVMLRASAQDRLVLSGIVDRVFG